MNTEVRDDGLAAGKQNVLGPDVTMDDRVAMAGRSRPALSGAVRCSETQGGIMNVSRSKSSLPRFLACALLLVFASSCMTPWRRQPGDPRSIIEAKQPTQIRLWRAGGSVVLENPTIVGDSLVGWSTEGQMSARVATPLDQIRAVETRGIDGGKTALAVLGVAATVALIAAIASYDPPPKEPATCKPGDEGKICSCPLVYSWDGETWRLDSGTFGGAITRAAARTDVDNLVYATPTDGVRICRRTLFGPHYLERCLVVSE